MTSRDDVRTACGIPKGEHLIGWCTATDGTVLAATGAALYRDQQVWSDRIGHALPWVSIATAVWDTPILTITWEDGALVEQRINIGEPGELPSAIQAMVTESVVYRQHVPLLDLPDDAGALLVARRQPRQPDAQVTWSVVFDTGLDPRDTALRGAADQALLQVRAALGI